MRGPEGLSPWKTGPKNNHLRAHIWYFSERANCPSSTPQVSRRMSKQLLLHPSCCRVHRQVLLRQVPRLAMSLHTIPKSVSIQARSLMQAVCATALLFLLCVCACVHMCVQVCVIQTSTSGLFLDCSLLHSFGEQDLSLNLEFMGWLAREPRGPTVSSSPMLEL